MVEATPSCAEAEAAPFDAARAFDAHGGALLGFCVNAVGDRARGEDLVQEVFVRAWRWRTDYDHRRASERTWLFAIARNVVIDDVRARARRPYVLQDPPERAAEHRTDETVERRLELVAGLAGMSREHREVVTAVHLDGETYAEVSARTGTSVATLRSRMHYGLRAMRRHLEDEGWRDR